MSENAPEKPAQATEEKPAEEQTTQAETDWKAEARKWETRAKENSEAAKKLADLEEANKSELEKEREARSAAEKERDSAKTEALRLSVAHAKGLTPGQAKRLVGSTKEELEADADEILAEFGTTKKAAPAPKTLKSGSSSSEPTGEKGRAAAALRQLRQG